MGYSDLACRHVHPSAWSARLLCITATNAARSSGKHVRRTYLWWYDRLLDSGFPVTNRRAGVASTLTSALHSPPPCGEGLRVGGIPTADVLQSPPPNLPHQGGNCVECGLAYVGPNKSNNMGRRRNSPSLPQLPRSQPPSIHPTHPPLSHCCTVPSSVRCRQQQARPWRMIG
jgi:hypothetical protein